MGASTASNLSNNSNVPTQATNDSFNEQHKNNHNIKRENKQEKND
jgi:hypothetical protein